LPKKLCLTFCLVIFLHFKKEYRSCASADTCLYIFCVHKEVKHGFSFHYIVIEIISKFLLVQRLFGWPSNSFKKLSIFYFFDLQFLLACNSYKGDTLWYLRMYLWYVLVRFTPSIVPPHSLTTFLEQFQQVSLFYFHVRIQNTSYTFTLIHPFLTFTLYPTLVPILGKDLFDPLAFHFLLSV
jgi:hypothetical protein